MSFLCVFVFFSFILFILNETSDKHLIAFGGLRRSVKLFQKRVKKDKPYAKNPKIITLFE
jgi:hypothetical protein